jgi:hypothetical protein
VKAGWPTSDLRFYQRGRDQSGNVLYHVTYVLNGGDSNIAWDAPGQLVAAYAAEEADDLAIVGATLV